MENAEVPVQLVPLVEPQVDAAVCIGPTPRDWRRLRHVAATQWEAVQHRGDDVDIDAEAGLEGRRCAPRAGATCRIDGSCDVQQCRLSGVGHVHGENALFAEEPDHLALAGAVPARALQDQADARLVRKQAVHRAHDRGQPSHIDAATNHLPRGEAQAVEHVVRKIHPQLEATPLAPIFANDLMVHITIRLGLVLAGAAAEGTAQAALENREVLDRLQRQRGRGTAVGGRLHFCAVKR
mmetsp:Transcript_125896/g.362034  ORF Transcript_125896/g.362034 Transcript_125896/m.362034 type:complete len:238 (+) Transcript_125896:313-1026(+)